MKANKKIIAVLACLVMVSTPLMVATDIISNDDCVEADFYEASLVFDDDYDNALIVSLSPATSVEIPTKFKEGYTLQYWLLGVRQILPGTYTLSELEISFPKYYNFYSSFTPNTYTLKLMNGSTLVQQKSCVYDSEIGSLPSPTKPGYNFLGWSPTGNTWDIVSSSTIYKKAGDMILYAVWKEATYNVTFIDDGKVCSSKQCTYKSVYGELPTLYKDGYIFKGWAKDLSGVNMVTADTTYLYTSNSSLYAVWIPKQFTMSFNDNGTVIGSRTIDYGSTIGEMPTPISKGKTFLGWSLDGTGGTMIDSNSKFTYLNDITVFSVWKTNSYKVTFIDRGSELSSKNVLYGAEYGEMPAPTSTGHTLLGWSTDGTASKIVSPQDIMTYDSNISLYSVWDANSYKVSFIDDGAEIGSKTVRYGDTFGTMITPSHVGKTFLGWSTDGTEGNIVSSGTVFTYLFDVELHSVWSINSYKISFIDDGKEISSKNLAYGSEYGEMPSLKVAGKTFLGWSTDGTEGKIVGQHDVFCFDGDTSLYSVWRIDTYKISFIDDGKEISSKNTTYGSAYGEMPTLTKTGYTFFGWSLDGTKDKIVKSQDVFNYECNIMLYSVWSINSYMITFMDNGSEVSSKTITYGMRLGDMPELTKSGNTFLGWSTDGSPARIVSSDDLFKQESDLKLYSVWLVNSYKITFMDGGKEISSKTIKYGSEFGELPSIEASGKAFWGWSTDGTKDNIVKSQDIFNYECNLMLYSVWSSNAYKITFFDDGKEISSKNIAHGMRFGDMPVLSKTGYTFLGWSTDGSPARIVSSDDLFKLESDLKLYSVWDVNTYNVKFIDNGKEIDSKKVAYGDKIGSMTTPTCKGKNFIGWSLDGTVENIITSDTVFEWTHAIELQSVWSDIVYVITFVSNDAEIGTKDVTYGSKIGEMPEVTCKGKTFKGWSTDGTTSGILNADSVFTFDSNTRLYALFEDNEYTVTFDSKGATTTPEPIKCKYLQSFGTLPTVEKTGKRFLGWSTTEDGSSMVTSESVLKDDSDTTLYAIWGDEISAPAESSMFDNPMSIVAMVSAVLATIGISFWIYRKGLL